jgi:hypothetical protein
VALEFKVQNVQAVQPQPEADQPLAELLPAPFNSPSLNPPRDAAEERGGDEENFRRRIVSVNYSE